MKTVFVVIGHSGDINQITLLKSVYSTFEKAESFLLSLVGNSSKTESNAAYPTTYGDKRKVWRYCFTHFSGAISFYSIQEMVVQE